MSIWKYINVLSLDIALGAVVGCAFFAQVFGVSLLPHAYISLGLIVWMIYTVDHLVDARRSAEPSTHRHRFHKEHSRLLTMAVMVVAVIVAFEAFYVRKPVLIAGFGVAMLVMGYLMLQARLTYLKEATGTILYTAGIVAAPWSLMDRSVSLPEVGLVLLYGMTACINLLLFSWFDRETDTMDGHISFATTFGDARTQQTISAVFLVVSVTGSLLIVWFPTLAFPIALIMVMNALLYLTFRFPDFYRTDDRYRRIGDFVFLIPGLYVLYTYGLEWI